MRNIYNLSFPFAWTLSLVAVVTCGNGVYVNLHDLALHGRIEHDGSLAHDDALPGHKFAPSDVDLLLLQELLDQSPHRDFLTLEDLAAARLRRDLTLKRPLDGIHTEIANGECALIFGIFANEQGEISKQTMKQWFGEDRLPNDWTRPVNEVRLLATHAISKRIGMMVTQLKSLLPHF